MTATTTTEAIQDATALTGPAAAAAVAGGARVRGMALALWGVVGSLLGYGVLMTAIKATALFG